MLKLEQILKKKTKREKIALSMFVTIKTNDLIIIKHKIIKNKW